MKYIYTLILFALFSLTASAQTGTLSGTMTEQETGEPIMFGNVFVTEMSTGTTSDLDGVFTIDLPVGKYSVVFSYVGLAELTKEEVTITENTVTSMQIEMTSDSEILEEIVITATQSRATETALLSIRKKSTSVVDGLSADSFKKIGDSDAAAAIKRVPGVSIEGGKYVYVRGLGDRYSKTLLNGMDIPGLDPDKNSVQMDIFPTNVLDNLIVAKTLTADMPADFAGGVINITTKDIPEYKTMNFGISMGYTPGMHFNNQFLTSNGSSTDVLGFDNDYRQSPIHGIADSEVFLRTHTIGSDTRAGAFTHVLNNFERNIAAQRESAFLDWGASYSVGNKIELENGNSIGYFASASYKQSRDYFQDVVYSRYGRDNNKDVTELGIRELQTGDIGEENVFASGLAGLSFKTNTAKYSLNIMHLQNGQNKVGDFKFQGSDEGSDFSAIQQNVEYTQRGFTNVLLIGRHSLGNESNASLTWKLSPTRSIMNDPDVKFTRYETLDNGTFRIGTESGVPQRIWRSLEEWSYNGKLDYKTELKSHSLSAGFSHSIKDRDFSIENFQIVVGDEKNESLTGNYNEILDRNGLWTQDNINGVYHEAQFVPKNPNAYNSTAQHSAAYLSDAFQITEKLKTIVGVRVENYNQKYSGLNQNGQRFDDRTVLDDLDVFPTVNMIYSVTEKSNLRASAYRTIARPSFKEASFATIFDPVTGRTFIGGFFQDIDPSSREVIWDGNLQSTDITNLDLRWEMFGERAQSLSVSGFYKHFTNPIEIVQYVQADNNFQPRNVGNGRVLGIELEMVKNLEFITESLKNFKFNTNITVTDSRITMSTSEFNSRSNDARTGQTVSDTRDMAGQAPYVINAGLAFNTIESGWNAGLYYNVQGETLEYVGAADRPDVYSRPFHSLNLNVNRRFGSDNKLSIGLKVENLLGSKKEMFYSSYQASEQLFQRINPRTGFSVNLGYTF